MLKLLVFVVLFIKFKEILSITKTFRYNVNADNPENYEEAEDCRGFQFPKSFDNACMMSLGKIETNELFLPADGEIVFRENADIVFTEKSKNCIKVKQPSYKEWADPGSWLSELSENLAVPHTEMVPFICDEVIFPKDALYSVALAEDQTYLLSDVRFRDSSFEQFRMEQFLGKCPEMLGNFKKVIKLNDAALNLCCNESLKPLFFPASILTDSVCATFKPDPMKCSEPVNLVGHCSGFCGVVILLEYPGRENYMRVPIENYLKNNGRIDFYYSVINKETIQISITDKNDFTGDSVLYAEKLYEHIRKIAKEYNIINNTQLMTSGMPLVAGKIAKSAFGVILGTLVFVLSTFAVLYVFYEGPFRHYNFSSRLNLSRYNQALRRSVIFSRFDNREGGISIAGSVMSLEKAFDNPMFGQPAPSTSYDSSTETVVDEANEVCEEVEEKVEQDITKGTEFKNPTYDNEGIETISIIEESTEDLTVAKQD